MSWRGPAAWSASKAAAAKRLTTLTMETEITFASPAALRAGPEAVWEALTSPTELTRWFPPGARVEPRAGGVLQLSWGDPFSGA